MNDQTPTDTPRIAHIFDQDPQMCQRQRRRHSQSSR